MIVTQDFSSIKDFLRIRNKDSTWAQDTRALCVTFLGRCACSSWLASKKVWCRFYAGVSLSIDWFSDKTVLKTCTLRIFLEFSGTNPGPIDLIRNVVGDFYCWDRTLHVVGSGTGPRCSSGQRALTSSDIFSGIFLDGLLFGLGLESLSSLQHTRFSAWGRKWQSSDDKTTLSAVASKSQSFASFTWFTWSPPTSTAAHKNFSLREKMQAVGDTLCLIFARTTFVFAKPISYAVCTVSCLSEI